MVENLEMKSNLIIKLLKDYDLLLVHSFFLLIINLIIMFGEMDHNQIISINLILIGFLIIRLSVNLDFNFSFLYGAKNNWRF